MGVRGAGGVAGSPVSVGIEKPDERRANFRYPGSPGNPTPVGLFPSGTTPTGLHDMAGNVWEWVEDPYGENEDRSVLRGGRMELP
jgi:formylglycine-generating enzyme required for sulfatase activity